MSTKIVNITVLDTDVLPDIISTFTPEENYMMLKIGSDCIKQGRKNISTLTQKEIYEKIKNETQKDIQKLEMDLLVAKNIKLEREEQIKKIYESQMDKLKKENDELIKQLTEYSNDNSLKIQKEVDKVIEKNKLLLDDKNRQISKFAETYEKLLKQNETKSSKRIGDEGEDLFLTLSNTFKDFPKYKIEKKAHIGHKGDFHLFFDDFNVLVDLKKYSGSVQKKEIEKIEQDLIANSSMNYAWLISLDTNVSDWNRFPLMCKWVVTETETKCILIINNFSSHHKNLEDALRNIWYMTSEIHKLLNQTKMDDYDVKLMKERDYNVIQKIKNTQKRLTELKKNVTSISQIIKDTDNELTEMLNLLSNELLLNKSNTSLKIKEWWNENIEFNEETQDKLTTTEIWTKLKKQNKNFIDETNLTINDLKEQIKTFVSSNYYCEKSKGGTIEFTGFKFKQDNSIIQPIMNIELVTNKEKTSVITKKTKKNNKNKNVEGISDEDNEKIINEYNTSEKKVMEISNEYNVMTWQVVSLLVNTGIIKDRKDARGYSDYIISDEYKQRIEEINKNKKSK
jgi:hypothetical protein